MEIHSALFQYQKLGSDTALYLTSKIIQPGIMAFIILLIEKEEQVHWSVPDLKTFF